LREDPDTNEEEGLEERQQILVGRWGVDLEVVAEKWGSEVVFGQVTENEAI